MNYYNENDPFAASWLRELIKSDCISNGEVDDRGIEDVRASDLRGFQQCHFFAGIGVWSYALRLAGWNDDRPVWTGSCPCQPFSAAGKREGFDDPRHLWPQWFRLIKECRPQSVFGEQVASALSWLDLVSGNLEDEKYAFGAAVLGAHSVGGPHIRQRVYWVAVEQSQREQVGIPGCAWESREAIDKLAHPTKSRRTEEREHNGGPSSFPARSVECGGDGRLADTGSKRRQQINRGAFSNEITNGRRTDSNHEFAGDDTIDGQSGLELPKGISGQNGPPTSERQGRPSGTSYWSDCDWLPCIDGKSRPVEPPIQRMADGSTESLGPVCFEDTKAIEEEILNAIPNKIHAGETLFDLQQAFQSTALEQRHTGGLCSVQQTPVLLAFLRQLSKQGWAFSEGIPREGAQAKKEELRGVRSHASSSCSSCGRKLEEQRTKECSDPLHILSSILARHAQKTWGEVFNANAKAVFPLIHGAPNRVGRLRGYGNALVAPQAAEFVRACMEALSA